MPAMKWWVICYPVDRNDGQDYKDNKYALRICIYLNWDFLLFKLETLGDIVVTTGRSLNVTYSLIYHYNASLLHWTHIYLFHTYLSKISSNLRQLFYHIFDRHASLKPVWFNKVICQSPNFKKLISVMTLAPELSEAVMHLACCLTWHLIQLPSHILYKVKQGVGFHFVIKAKRDNYYDWLVFSLCQCNCCFHCLVIHRIEIKWVYKDIKSSEMR